MVGRARETGRPGPSKTAGAALAGCLMASADGGPAEEESKIPVRKVAEPRALEADRGSSA